MTARTPYSLGRAPIRQERLLLWAVALLGLGLVAAAYHSGIANLVDRWGGEEEYSHGFVIPLIAAYFLWSRREALKRIPLRPSWTGVALVAYGVFQLALGELSALYILVHTSLLIVLCGLVLAYAGWAMLRAVLVPILLLGFAIPLPYFIDAILTWRLQIVSSVLGVSVIRGFGIPVFLDGNVIDLGILKLQVVEACSGLRYLFPLMSLGFIAAYMFRAPFWQRALVFLSTIPITIVMNSFRIGMVGMLVDRYGIAAAEGFMHDFEGWAVFMACTAILLAEISVLALLSGSRETQGPAFGPPPVPARLQRGAAANQRVSTPLVLSLGVLALAAAGVTALPERAEVLPPREPLVSFPTEVGPWQGRQGALDTAVLNGLQMDDYLYAEFARSAGSPVHLFVAFYESQRKGVSPHSPRVCIPGGGWRITELQRTTVETPGGTLPLTRAVIEKGSERQLVYYWFQQRGRRMANEFVMKAYLLVDALWRNRTDGALVRLVTPVAANERLETADARLLGFLERVDPMLVRFIPE